MKKIAVILFSIFTIGVAAQNNKNCVTPISNYSFSQKFSIINTKQGDSQKLVTAKNIVRSNCLSTAQVKQIAELFENDYNRLAFVQEAYKNTTDKDNFYEVYNSFMYFSTVFRLHDYITDLKTDHTGIIDDPASNEMTFPNIQYPDFRRYFGKTGCKNILPDEEFIQSAEKVFKEKSEYRKLMIANNIVYNNCFITSQAMKMASLLKNENDRLTFLKKAHTKVYDPDNYKYAHQLFKDAKNKREIQSLLSANVDIITEDPPCEVSTNDFQSIKNQINNERFNNTKINLAKQIIRSKNCFKTVQIIDLLRLFSYTDAKMTIAKFAYEFTTDKDKYYMVADVFPFSSDKDELLQFIKHK